MKKNNNKKKKKREKNAATTVAEPFDQILPFLNISMDFKYMSSNFMKSKNQFIK